MAGEAPSRAFTLQARPTPPTHTHTRHTHTHTHTPPSPPAYLCYPQALQCCHQVARHHVKVLWFQALVSDEVGVCLSQAPANVAACATKGVRHEVHLEGGLSWGSSTESNEQRYNMQCSRTAVQWNSNFRNTVLQILY